MKHSFISSQIVLHFQPISNFRREILKIEDHLTGDFITPVNLPPIPDDAPSEIPRLIATSKNGHSQLQISKNSISISTSYDNEYLHDWQLCKTYISNKISLITENIRSVLGIDIAFIGLTFNIEYSDVNEPAASYIVNKLFNINNFPEVHDFASKVTVVKNDKYYLNYTYSNSRRSSSTQFPINKDDEEHGINVSLDFNDRYAHQYQSNYKPDENTSSELLSILENAINSDPLTILEKRNFE